MNTSQSGIGISVSFEGFAEMVKDLGAKPAMIQRAVHSSIKSALFHVRLKLKAAVKDNEFGWPDKRPFPTKKQATEFLTNSAAGHRSIFRYKKTPFFGALGRLMFYSYDESKYSGEVGAVDARNQQPISENGKNIWRKLQMGYEKPVDASTRRFFHAIGIHIKDSTSIFKVPARPLFGPVAEKRASEVNALINMVLMDKITQGFQHTDFLDNAFMGSR